MKTRTMEHNKKFWNLLFVGGGGGVAIFQYIRDYLMHPHMLDINLGPDFGSILLKGFLVAVTGGAGGWLGKKLIELAWKSLTTWWQKRKERKPKNP